MQLNRTSAIREAEQQLRQRGAPRLIRGRMPPKRERWNPEQYRQSSSECRGDYTPGELRRWRDDIRQAAGSTSGVTGLAVFRSPCYLVRIEAESIRPALDGELKRRGVPLNAVQVQVLRVILDGTQSYGLSTPFRTPRFPLPT